MLTKDQLSSIGIFEWENFGDEFYESDILIGNGFSINLCSRLSYKALYQIFSSFTSNELNEIFKEFKTSNFEFIIDSLGKTKTVSTILKQPLTSLDSMIVDLKKGLIKSIEITHPTYQETDDRILRSLATELLFFRNIYTTNYDVFLYKIILANNTLIERKLLEGILFQDAFYEEISSTQLGFGTINDSLRQIYYLHGALFLYNPYGTTYKLRKIDSAVEFIKLIRREVENDNFPLFVAEGSSEDKRMAINNNYYLRTCSDALKRKKDKMTVYGFSFSRHDQHIIDLINTSEIKSLLLSVYPNFTLEEMQTELSRINNLFPNTSVSFFDSRSLFEFSYPKYSY